MTTKDAAAEAAEAAPDEAMSPTRELTILLRPVFEKRGLGPVDASAFALAAAATAIEAGWEKPRSWSTPIPEGPPPECPTGQHDWYVHEHNTPCYGFDGEINLPPGTVHCRDCFKVKP